MNKSTEVYLKNILEDAIDDILTTIGFNIDNENKGYEIKEELSIAVLDDKPSFLWKYIKEYMKKNYPYNISK